LRKRAGTLPLVISPLGELRIELVMTPATAMAGFRAKVRVVQQFNNRSPGYADPCAHDAIAWSLANDLLGVASVCAEEADEAAVA